MKQSRPATLTAGRTSILLGPISGVSPRQQTRLRKFLAGAQVGFFDRMATGGCEGLCFVFCNPEVIDSWGESLNWEGCLSLTGGHRAKVKRPAEIVMRYQDLDGHEQELEAEGLLARAIQHEIDHMRGRYFVDCLSSIRRELILAKFREQQKQGAFGNVRVF